MSQKFLFSSIKMPMLKSFDKKKKQTAKYIILDLFASLLAWSLFFIFRRIEIESTFVQNIQLFSPIYNFWKLLVGVPVFWFFIFWLSGYYNKAFHKSRVSEFFQTLTSVFFGSILLFFILLINDPVVSYKYYYLSFIVLFAIYFIVVYTSRYTLTRITTHKIHNRTWGFNTLIIGTGNNAKKIYDQIISEKQSSGFMICGFISDDKYNTIVNKQMILGGLPDLNRIIKEKNIENIIVAIDNDDKNELFRIINQLYHFNVEISFIPQLYDYLVGGIRLSIIYGTPLVNILENKMPAWQQNTKRLFDIVISVLGLILTSPLLLYLAIRVKLSSKGKIFFRQERIGLQGVPFQIIKFRTMYESKNNGKEHRLTEIDDERVTPIGKIMRKYRLDELPQLCNVLKGDMSLVGPRPEQKYYVDKIVEIAPYYSLILKVKPGITSWGMVKYGYANTVDKMIERLNYDIIYMENVSILLDIKIIIYTVKTIFSGEGI
ncbi:MAG TPA: sugar transferase [Paludibacteraceae bacterium]|nr:sugar transferase [Paludibacteraceae bacterium]HPH62604.1 sugar transferase [Paludibacteraceae bacterium]